MMNRVTTLAFTITLLQALSVPAGQLALYELEIHNTWSTTTHPGLFPENAHFSWLGGGTHSNEVSFWEEGQLASPGMVEMAETGVTDILKNEFNQAIDAGDAFSSLQYRWWFCPTETNHASCGNSSITFQVCLLYTSPSPRDATLSRMPSSA